MTIEGKENIKYRLSDLGVKVGELVLNYINELEKENEELKEKVADLTAEREHHLNLMKGLNAKINSMKCCENCKNWSDGDCMALYFCADYECDKWELA